MTEFKNRRCLTPFEKDELLRFFLHCMKSEQRNLLMAKYPVHYAVLYPTVDPNILANRVQDAIDDLPENDLIASSAPYI